MFSRIEKGKGRKQTISEQLPCRSAEVKFFSVFAAKDVYVYVPFPFLFPELIILLQIQGLSQGRANHEVHIVN